MLKREVIKLLGGESVHAVQIVNTLMGYTRAGVHNWPDVLKEEVALKVLGVAVRERIKIPADMIPPPLVDGTDLRRASRLLHLKAKALATEQQRIGIQAEAKEVQLSIKL